MKFMLSNIHKIACVLGGLYFAAADKPAYAQNVLDAARRQASDISRQFTDEVRQREEKALDMLRRAPRDRSAPAQDGDVQKRSGPCFKISRVEVTGVTIFPDRDIRLAVTTIPGKCIFLSDLNPLLKKITMIYFNKGFIATRAYLPEQDLGAGVLKIEVVEDTLSDLKILNGQAQPGQLATAFPDMIGKPLNLRSVEQGIDQINRLRSTKATVTVEPGSAIGQSVLGLSFQNGRPWFATASLDTMGSRSTGLYQSRMDFGIENILGLNDQISATVQRSSADPAKYFERGEKEAHSGSLSISVPYGAWIFGASGSFGNYQSFIQGVYSKLPTSGTSRSFSTYSSLVFDRDQISKSWLTGRTEWKTSDNYLAETKIENSSRSLSIMSLELGHARTLWGGAASSRISYQYATHLDSYAGGSDERGGALSWSGDYSREFDAGTLDIGYTATVSGDWSSDDFPSAERMGLGGNSTIRGVRNPLLFSSRTILFRNELSLSSAKFTFGSTDENEVRFEPFLALDVGKAFPDRSAGNPSGHLLGGTLGLRARGSSLNFDLSYSDLLSVSGAVKGKSGLAQARLSISF